MENREPQASKIIPGALVLIRTYTAGVHFGTLEERRGQEVRLSKARRVWRWDGAFTLSEIATTGLDVAKSRIADQVEEIILPEAIEIIPISEKSNIVPLCN